MIQFQNHSAIPDLDLILPTPPSLLSHSLLDCFWDKTAMLHQSARPLEWGSVCLLWCWKWTFDSPQEFKKSSSAHSLCYMMLALHSSHLQFWYNQFHWYRYRDLNTAYMQKWKKSETFLIIQHFLQSFFKKCENWTSKLETT